MAKFISFGHLNIDGADELHITAKHDPPVDRCDILGRLVMDPILPDSLSAIIGQEVKLFLPTGVSGPLILEEVTDYDLICSGRGMKELVFERASVLNIVTREED